MSNSILFDIDNRGVATVTLNRADKHNAFDDTIIADLTAVFTRLERNDKARLMVLAANGKNFSAGGDLNWMKRMVDYSHEENRADAKNLAIMLNTLNNLSVPTIARVQGAAFGGAVGLVSCCDMAVANQEASFCLSEVKVGIAPATISPYVVAAMGSRASRRYFLTAERFSSAQALALGLISEVAHTEQLDFVIEKLIGTILANSPNAVKTSKQLIRKVEHQEIDDDLMDYTSEVIASLRVSKEGQEGLSAFFEKRAPSWQKHSE